MMKRTNDLIFKLIFGSPGNTDILAAFLMSVLNLPEKEYETLTIVDPHTRIESENGKHSILDIKLHTKSQNVIDIEIQVADTPQLKKRILFYTAKMLTEQLDRGEDYDKLRNVVTILITDYSFIEDSDLYHHRYRFYDENAQSLFSDTMEINVLELPKLPPNSDATSLWDWLRFLKTDREEEMKMLAQKNEKINRAFGVLMELSEDEKVKLRYEAREKAERDERDRLKGSLAKGIEIGMEKGMEKGMVAVAKKMLEENMSAEVISRFTGLSIAEIENLDA